MGIKFFVQNQSTTSNNPHSSPNQLLNQSNWPPRWWYLWNLLVIFVSVYLWDLLVILVKLLCNTWCWSVRYMWYLCLWDTWYWWHLCLWNLLMWCYLWDMWCWWYMWWVCDVYLTSNFYARFLARWLHATINSHVVTHHLVKFALTALLCNCFHSGFGLQMMAPVNGSK
jgi:hypothetical protein